MKGIFLTVLPFFLLFFPNALPGDDFIQKVDDGFINWTELTVTLTGSGVPDLGISNTGSAKLSADRSARMNALHRLSKALGSIGLGNGKTLEKHLLEIKDGTFLKELSKNAQWSSMTQGAQYSDGSVEYVFKFDLQPYLKEIVAKTKDAFFKEVPKPAETQSAPAENRHDLLLIDMRKLKAGRVLFPSVETADGEIISSFTDFQCAAGKGDDLITKLNVVNHLRISPLKIKDGSAIIVNKEDASKIKTTLDAGAFSNGRVIILFK